MSEGERVGRRGWGSGLDAGAVVSHSLFSIFFSLFLVERSETEPVKELGTGQGASGESA